MSTTRTSAMTTLPRPGRRSLRWLRWPIAALCVGLGAGAGVGVHRELPVVYTASTSVLVLPTSGGVDSSVGVTRAAAEVQIETEAELVHSAQVASVASQALGRALSVDQLLAQSSVSVPANSEVLVVRMRAATPELARDASMSMSVAYLERRAEQADAQVNDVVSNLEAQLAELNTRLEENSTALAAAGANPAQQALAESSRNLVVDQISDINSRLVALRFQTTTGGEVITEADLPQRPTSPDLAVVVGAGLVVGALVGAGAILLIGQVRRPGRGGGAPPSWFAVLGAMSVAERGSVQVGAVHREALVRLRDKISSHVGDQGPLVVSGIGDALLRTRVAFELTESWAPAGGAVLVVAEPHPGSTTVPAARERGLSDVLGSRVAAADATHVVAGSAALVMGPGADLEDLGDAVRPDRLDHVWFELGSSFSTVVVQTGSPLDSHLAASVVQTAGRIVVVADVKLSQSRELTSALEELEVLGLSDRVVGVILVSDESESETERRNERGAVALEARAL